MSAAQGSGTLLSRKTLNFTRRVELRPQDFDYRLGRRSDGTLSFRVNIKTWPEIAALLDGRRIDVILQFRAPLSYGVRPDKRYTLCEANAAEGVFEGNIPDVAAVRRLGLDIIVVDSAHNKLVHGHKASPDFHLEDVDAPKRPDKKKQQRHDSVDVDTNVAPSGSLLYLCRTTEVSGFWDVKLEHEGRPMPVLLLHPDVGMHAIRSNPVVQALILPEAFRRVVTAMMLNSRWSDAPWYAAWYEFAASMTPSGEDILFYTDGLDPGDPALDPERVANLVAIGTMKFTASARISFPALADNPEEGH